MAVQGILPPHLDASTILISVWFLVYHQSDTDTEVRVSMDILISLIDQFPFPRLHIKVYQTSFFPFSSL